MDFNKTICENKKLKRTPFLAAHRGVCGANIPCNTLLAYKIAVDQGAEVVEIDVAKSKDGKFFAFHPGMESVYLKTGKNVSEMTADEVAAVRILNCDEVTTHYSIPTLQQALLALKDKCYINVDKFWTDVEGITAEIRKAGVEKQVIVKSNPEEPTLSLIERYAPDFMYMAFVNGKDDVTDSLIKRRINYIGVEALFDSLSEIASKKYIDGMHVKGLLVWANSIVYNEQAILSAGLTDDVSLESGGDYGWGKLYKMGFDFIQTDWLLPAKIYFSKLDIAD